MFITLTGIGVAGAVKVCKKTGKVLVDTAMADVEACNTAALFGCPSPFSNRLELNLLFTLLTRELSKES